MKTALVAIMKQPANLNEWIHYHLALGFDHIFAGINDDDIPHFASDQVSFIPWHVPESMSAQFSFYSEVTHLMLDRFDWAAYIDDDEYIWTNGEQIDQFLQKYNDCCVLDLNWRFFCSKDDVAEPKDSFLKRFTWCAKEGNKHVKPILNLAKCRKDRHMDNVTFINPHLVGYPYAIPHYTTDRRLVAGPYNENPDVSKGYIAHFYSRTKDEFEAKINRGRPDCPKTSEHQYYNIQDHMWQEYEKCHMPEIENNKLKEFIYG